MYTAALLALLCTGLAAPSGDWLITDLTAETQPYFRDNGDGTWTLGNNLISRTFRYGGPPGSGFGTLDYRSEMADVSLIRAIDAEGYLSLDAKGYSLGTLIQTGTQYVRVSARTTPRTKNPRPKNTNPNPNPTTP